MEIKKGIIFCYMNFAWICVHPFYGTQENQVLPWGENFHSRVVSQNRVCSLKRLAAVCQEPKIHVIDWPNTQLFARLFRSKLSFMGLLGEVV